jgi:hypothetical protein
LTGLDTPKFKAALEGIMAIHGKFAKSIGTDQLLPWVPGLYQNRNVVHASNNYFLSGRRVANAEVEPFSPLVDPLGLLATVDQNVYRHTRENVVGYFVKESGETANRYA